MFGQLGDHRGINLHGGPARTRARGHFGAPALGMALVVVLSGAWPGGVVAAARPASFATTEQQASVPDSSADPAGVPTWPGAAAAGLSRQGSTSASPCPPENHAGAAVGNQAPSSDTDTSKTNCTLPQVNGPRGGFLPTPHASKHPSATGKSSLPVKPAVRKPARTGARSRAATPTRTAATKVIAAAATYTITGKVTGPGSVALANIDVSANGMIAWSSATTAADGTYSIPVSPDTYTVQFSDSAGMYVSGYYSTSGFTVDANAASPVTVTTANVAGINVTLPKTVYIKGKVTGPGAVALAGIDVYAGANTYGNSATTAADGTYSVAVAPGMSYTVSFSDSNQVYASGYYSSGGYTADGNAATAVPVGSTDVTGINVTLPKAVHIKGKVTGAGGVALENIDVSASGNNSGNSTTTAADGTYTIAVNADTYVVQFSDSAGTYAGGYYSTAGFTPDWATASAVTVGTADVTINMTLPKAVHIKGKVTGPGAVALANIDVSVWLQSGNNSYYATTAADGTYSVPVAPGTSYQVGFSDSSQVSASGWYGSSGYTASQNAAKDVAVGTADVTGINVTLPKALHIKGKVTGAGGVPLANIYVGPDSTTYDTTGPSNYTAADGTYSVVVTPGKYLVTFQDEGQVYASGYYSSAGFTLDGRLATKVAVTAADVTSINVQLMRNQVVSGKITGPGGIALPDLHVTVASTVYAAGSSTAADGTYSVGVPAGTYTVAVDDFSSIYGSGFWTTTGFTRDATSASSLVVTTAARTGINVTLPKNPRITGKVTGAGGAALANIDVWSNGSRFGSNTTTATDGTYALPVNPDTYTVQFSDSGGTYAGGYYSTSGFTADPDTATSLTPASADVTGINVTLPKAVHIKGKVTGAGGVALANVSVTADTWNSFRATQATTASDGTFALAVAPNNGYQVSFSDDSLTYVGGYYSTAGYTADQAAAADVFLGSADVTGINVTLPKALHVVGKLTGPGGVAAAGINVYVNSNGQFAGGSATSKADGTYSLAVGPGIYRLQVSPDIQPGVYPEGYYSTAGFTLDPGAASGVIVTTADVVANLQLPKMVLITGKVTGPGGVALVGLTVASSADMSASQAETAADGTYSLPVPAGNNWSVQAYDPDNTYTSGFYSTAGFTSDPSHATSITVGTANVGGINLQLPKNLTVSGKVTKAGGAGVPNVDVYAGSPLYGQSAQTAGDGSFSIGVPAGSYTVSFSDENGVYAGGYYGPAGFSLDTSKTVTLATAIVTGVSVQLPALTSVSGTVADSGGAGLGGIRVYASSVWSSTNRDYVETLTAANGNYTLLLAPGAFTVGFTDPSQVHTSAYYAGAAVTLDSNTATRLAVGSSALTGIGGRLGLNHHIKGKVTGPSGTALPGVSVTAVSTTWQGRATTAGDGTYSIAVPAGSFGVMFGGAQGYTGGYYSTAGLKQDRADASAVTVTTADATGINGALAGWHKISGRITGAGAAGLPGVSVCATSASQGDCRSTATDGTYAILVPSGAYTVFADPTPRWDWSGPFSSGYYASSGFTPSRASAKTVTVGTADVAGINVVLPRNLQVKGRLTAANGVGISGPYVRARSDDEYPWAITAPDGRYTLNVPAGSYTISYVTWNTNGFASGWYGTAGFTADTPAQVSVTTANVALVNVVLPRAAWIRGRVTRSGGGAFGAIAVTATATGGYLYGLMADSDGSFAIPVVPGTYKVSYADDWNSGPYLRIPNGYYSTAGFTLSEASATSLTVGSGGVSAINAQLPDGRRISGFVTGANKLPLEGVVVMATSSTYSVTEYTDGQGAYALPVPTGSFVVSFSDPTGATASGYYSSGGLVYPPASATPVSVSSANAANINVVLPKISGATYHAVTPYRVLDSRYGTGGTIFHSRTKQTVTIATAASKVPATAVAVVGNVTVTGQTKLGYVTLAPSLTSGVQPPTSTMNFPVGDNRVNGVTLPLAAGGKLDFMYWAATTADTVQILFDVTGYFTK